MEKKYKYKEEDYFIRFNEINERIKIYYDNKVYLTNYTLKQISDKIKDEVNKIQKYEKISNITEKRKQLQDDFDIINCLQQNIDKNQLTFGTSYSNYLPSFWNLFPEDEEKKNQNDLDIDSFQINLYSNLEEYKLLLINFNQNINLINEDEDQNEKIIQTEINKIQKFVVYTTIDDLNNRNDINIEGNFKKVFILEEEKKKKKKKVNELNEEIKKLIDENYMEQIFIIIINKTNNMDNVYLKSNIEKEKLKDFLSVQEKKCYFDMDNIIVINNYNKLAWTLLKIYMYFNQIDDYDFIDFIIQNNLLDKNIEGLKEEKDQIINNNHFINIKICGLSSVGKSTFINKILGEKRALIDEVTGTTNGNHIYLSKKYHLKLIDDLGFDQGEEGIVNEEIINLKNKRHTIILDQNIKLSYGYNNDFRNNIHLLLYLFRFQNPYNIVEGHFNYLKSINDAKIPIIFVINFSDDKTLNDRKKYKEDKSKCDPDSNSYQKLLNKIKNQLERKNKIVLIDKKKQIDEEKQIDSIDKKKQGENKKKQIVEIDEKIVPIMCLEKKGFNDLFEEIYNIFKDNVVETNILNILENGTNYEVNQNNFDLKEFIKKILF